MDWFTPLVGFLGLAIGFGYQEYRIRRERKDKYKDMVFEKRLDAHQGAHYWSRRFLGLMSPHRLVKEGAVAVVIKEVQEAYEWLTRNELYLDEASSLKMTEFLHYAAETCLRYLEYKKEGKNINVEEETRKLLYNEGVLSASIRKGIGVKYLPEQRISIDTAVVEKSLDEVVGGMEAFMEKEKEKG